MVIMAGSIEEVESLDGNMSGGSVLLAANVDEREELGSNLANNISFISTSENLESVTSNLSADRKIASAIEDLESIDANINGVINFEVNKQGLLIDGVEQSLGTIICRADVAGKWRSLLAAGKIRRVGQFNRDAFRSGERFKKNSKYTYSE